MRIPFADESRIVSRPPRNLSPEKQEIANKEFDDLLKKNFAVPNETKWSSPICLVTYADKAPRLTGDFSGKNGINDLSLTLEANLPKIADILPVLSKAIQKELYAILATLTLSLLSSFILTKRFTLFCDHKNLSYLISAPEKNRIVTRWIPWLKLLSQEQEQATKNNDITMTTDTELISMTANDKNYVLTWNHRKKKFVIPDSLKRHLLLTIHGSTRAGHPSKKDSVSALMRSDYWWPKYL
ncbi:hypothetical protein GEMRC1_010856 [Eukaryota sp. GEM-RC1]